MTQPWHYHMMAGMYVLAGLAHWLFPKAYLRILPRWVPWGRFTVWASGLLEVALGIGLWFPETRVVSLYGIMGMLLLFMPVHTHMLSDSRAGGGLPRWALWLRIPLQGFLIYWAWGYLEGLF